MSGIAWYISALERGRIPTYMRWQIYSLVNVLMRQLSMSKGTVFRMLCHPDVGSLVITHILSRRWCSAGCYQLNAGFALPSLFIIWYEYKANSDVSYSTNAWSIGWAFGKNFLPTDLAIIYSPLIIIFWYVLFMAQLKKILLDTKGNMQGYLYYHII